MWVEAVPEVLISYSRRCSDCFWTGPSQPSLDTAGAQLPALTPCNTRVARGQDRVQAEG